MNQVNIFYPTELTEMDDRAKWVYQIDEYSAYDHCM